MQPGQILIVLISVPYSFLFAYDADAVFRLVRDKFKLESSRFRYSRGTSDWSLATDIFNTDNWNYPPGAFIDEYISSSITCANLFPPRMWPYLTADGKPPFMVPDNTKITDSRWIMQFHCRDLTDPSRRNEDQIPQNLNHVLRNVGPFYIFCPLHMWRQYPVVVIKGYYYIAEKVEDLRISLALCANADTSVSIPLVDTNRKCVHLAYSAFSPYLPIPSKNRYGIVAWINWVNKFGQPRPYFWVHNFDIFPVLADGSIVKDNQESEYIAGKVIEAAHVVNGVDYKACVELAALGGSDYQDIRLNLAVELFVEIDVEEEEGMVLEDYNL